MRSHTLVAVACLAMSATAAAESTPSEVLNSLPRLPASTSLSCAAITPTTAHIEQQTKAMAEQAEFMAMRPRDDNRDAPAELTALLEDTNVTLCISEFGEYDWLMDLDFELDSALGGLREERNRRVEACPQRGGFPTPDCLAKLDAELADRARAATDRYLAQAQAGLDAEAGRMRVCTQRRDTAAEKLFAHGGFDLQALGLNVESWRLAQVATKRWKAVCGHASQAVGASTTDTAP